MRLLPFVLLVAVSSVQAPSGAEVQCLAPDVRVTLSGFVVGGLFPGPPEYASVAEGDEAYRAGFLYVDAPICLTDGNAPTTMVQLVCADADLPEGEVVSVTGTLFSAHTGYHRSPVLLACD